MSDPKRGGSRDISDLKARLGLKKGAADAPAAGDSGSVPAQPGTAATPAAASRIPAPTPRPSGGGVVPPPGLNLPPPPGLEPARPAQPAMPNAADDPFGAMNAMAARGNVQRAPEIVYVNDGKPVENVGAGGKGARIAKIAIPAVAALIVGVAIGEIASSANAANAGIRQSKAILGDAATQSTVANVKKQLAQLDGTLDEWKAGAYRPAADKDKQLGDIAAALAVKTDAVFATTNAIPKELNAQIMAFYAGVTEVKGMLDAHVKSAKSDDMLLQKLAKAQDAATPKETENATIARTGGVRYGVLLTAPTDAEKSEFGGKIVELGQPYCGTSISTTGGCENGAQPDAYTYRFEPGATWSKGDYIWQGADSIPSKKVVPLLGSGTRDALLGGADGAASEALYRKRLSLLAERTKKLLDEANSLQTALSKEASQSPHFSFFL